MFISAGLTSRTIREPEQEPLVPNADDRRSTVTPCVCLRPVGAQSGVRAAAVATAAAASDEGVDSWSFDMEESLDV